MEMQMSNFVPDDMHGSTRERELEDEVKTLRRQLADALARAERAENRAGALAALAGYNP
jgi:hypothetical protein